MTSPRRRRNLQTRFRGSVGLWQFDSAGRELRLHKAEVVDCVASAY
jgi:hypothetical protein